MMRLLIVDDEPEMLEILRSQLDCQRLGIYEVLSAGSYRQALEICAKTAVHIMICDIEMPEHSGLELLDEVNARYGNIVAIFLTAYDSFAYCKRALELGGLDYLLKPVQFSELEKAVHHAVDKVREQSKISRFTSFEEDIVRTSPTDGSLFWLNVINGLIPPQKEEFLSAAERYHIELDQRERYAILLLRTVPKEGAGDGDERRKQIGGLYDHLSQTLGCTVICALTLMEQYLAFVLYDCDRREAELVDKSDRLIAYANGKLCESAEAIVSGFVFVWTIPDQAEKLLWLFRNTLSTRRGTFSLKSQQPVGKLPPPPMEAWDKHLAFGRFASLGQEIERYLDEQAQAGRMAKEALAYFLYEFTHMVKSYLTDKNLPCDWATEDDPAYTRAFHSLAGCKAYTSGVLARLSQSMSEIISRSDIVESAKRYIQDHLYDAVSRNDIAEEIGVNAEYLSRLFKKRMKLSLVEYISREKMKIATNLLSTNMTVSEVAVCLGYTNFAYFTQIYKKYADITPSSFKKRLMNHE